MKHLLIEHADPFLEMHYTEFCAFVCEKLGLVKCPPIIFVEHTGNASFGSYSPSEGTIIVATNGRHAADVLRTLAHEMVHDQQITVGAEQTLEEMEYEANAIAGLLMRDWNKAHPELYGVTHSDNADGDEGESMGATFADPTRPTGPIGFAESAKAVHVGTCVNSFSRSTGECTIGHHLPYRDTSHFANSLEDAKKVSKAHFEKHASIPGHLVKVANHKSTDFYHDEEHGVHMIHDTKKDVHHFFTEDVSHSYWPKIIKDYSITDENKKPSTFRRGFPTKHKLFGRGRRPTKFGMTDAEKAKLVKEDAPVNAAGSGEIAGIGIGPQGEPGIKKSHMIRRKPKSDLAKIFSGFPQPKKLFKEYKARITKRLNWDQIEKDKNEPSPLGTLGLPHTNMRLYNAWQRNLKRKSLKQFMKGR